MNAYSTGRTRPFTGQEYLESLRDGREIRISSPADRTAKSDDVSAIVKKLAQP